MSPPLQQGPSGGARAPAALAPGGPADVVIQNRRTGFFVTALLGEDSPKVTGYGAWEEVTRRRRRNFPDWTHQPLLRLAVPLIFDGWARRRPQDRALRALENMASLRKGERPPTVKLYGPGVPHTDLVWVVEDIDWGAATKGPNGRVLRQYFTLNLLEWVDADVLAKRKRGRDGKGGRRSVRVGRRGDRAETLMELCARVLGDSSRWREVAKLNSIRDPRKLKVQQRIRLP